MPNQDTFFWNGDLRTGNTQSAKPKQIKATYPVNPTWNNPGQQTFTIDSQSNPKDVRGYYKRKMGEYNSLSQTDLWANGYHITNSMATGSPVTQVIQQEDQSFVAEAQKNSNVVQMLHQLRLENNTSDFNQFQNQAAGGQLQTIQNLLSSSLFSAFTGMGASSISTGTTQNTAVANNQLLNANNQLINANGQPIYANGVVIGT